MGFNKRFISYEIIEKRLNSEQSLKPLFNSDALIFKDQISAKVLDWLLSEWKKGRPAPTEKQMSDVSKKEITKSKKQQSREKLKEKQRSL